LENIKQKKCRECGNLFTPKKTTQRDCNWQCALIQAGKRTEKQKIKIDKSIQKIRKQNLKTLSQWKAEAQKVFNEYIRLRDKDLPCICCNRYPDSNDWLGGLWDCGHFLSVGSHPELRFEELNAHKQLKSCNAGAGKYTKKNYTVSKQYRENLIAKIGLEKVEWLESKHEPKHYRIDDIKQIIETYKSKVKELKCHTTA